MTDGSQDPASSAPEEIHVSVRAAPTTGPWGPEGPPEDAYSRATNLERFLPIREAAIVLLDELAAVYNVRSGLAPDLDEEWASRGLFREMPLARPSRKLTPTNPDAAPLGMIFTPLPGVMLRFGLGYHRMFPTCGCDACAETAEEEIEDMRREVEELVKSYLHERIEPPRGPDADVLYQFRRAGGAGASGGTDIPRDQAKMLIEAGMGERHWVPWTRA